MTETVKDFRAFIMKAAGVSNPSEFTDFSQGHLDFWEKLNRLGARNMDKFPLEECPNIDETVHLNSAELGKLLIEFAVLEGQRKKILNKKK